MQPVSGAFGFVGFIAACFVVARRFSWRKQRGWMAYSGVTGVVFAAAFLGIACGSQQGGAISTVVILAFTAAVVLGRAWLSAMQLQLTQEVAS
jgi:drug/metabolite transporter (DMT)-like permease